MKTSPVVALSLLAAFTAPHLTQAASYAPADLSVLIEQNLSRVSAQACSIDEDHDEGDGSQERSDWEIRHFFLNLSPYVTVGVRGIADVTITPEIELGWERVDN